MKRICLLSLLCVFIALSLYGINVSAAGPYNYAEALQKAIYFYECQQSGPLPSWNRARQWRGDSSLLDAVTGGWYAEGIGHTKYGMPMAYSAAMLGWSMYEYAPGFEAAGQTVALKNNLKFVLDYFVKCDKGTSFVYQIGTQTAGVWPVEACDVRLGVRPSFECRASCVTAQTAAALAIGYLVLGDMAYLTHARSLFSLADNTRSDADYRAALGYYSSSGFWDDLAWAAVWLYQATGEGAYLSQAEYYLQRLYDPGIGYPYIEWRWGQNWNDTEFGAILLLARITHKKEYHEFMKKHLHWWRNSGGTGERITYTPGGLAWLQPWGPLNCALNTAFLALVYQDMISDPTLKTAYRSFAEQQINYVLGDNPQNRSYIVGFGANPPQFPQHWTASGWWWYSSLSDTSPLLHTLYGALVNGPDQYDGFVDYFYNYNYTGVACDFNAGLAGVLAKMCQLYPGTPLSAFPPRETPTNEFFVEAAWVEKLTNSIKIKARLYNKSAWPARCGKNLSFRYYMDLSELYNAGYTANDLSMPSINVDPTFSGLSLVHLRDNIWYWEFYFHNNEFPLYPTGPYAGNITFTINSSGPWNPSNDFSCVNLTQTMTKVSRMPVYDQGTKLYGSNP